jgi:hypothetical protein
MSNVDVNAFDAYLQPRVSDNNRKSILRVAKKLVAGEGITHLARPGEVFYPHKLTLDDDLEAIQLNAAAWLPFRKGPMCLDKGHGWALNHPLQWLIHFKNHLRKDKADMPINPAPVPAPSMFNPAPVPALPLTPNQAYFYISNGTPMVTARPDLGHDF